MYVQLFLREQASAKIIIEIDTKCCSYPQDSWRLIPILRCLFHWLLLVQFKENKKEEELKKNKQKEKTRGIVQSLPWVGVFC